ncbi:unnamed protein product [Candidula unifasciata]|uniref:Major facilitator superfamily (MFS) profile domain-containing protein n=1 Tax=Candidula unifasciata TaxID=100452 RepID=A0A8S3ZA34_9EUPU|nr:unnamed protein product [Candidula unifasciata]
MTSNERKHLLETDALAIKQAVDEDNDYENAKEITEVPVCGSYRLLVIVCCTLSMTITYAAQASLSAAMVCMIDDRDFLPETGFYDNLTTENMTNGVFNFTTNNGTDDHSEEWLFRWDKTDQALAISTFFMGYYISQIPSSIAAARFGPKKVVVISLILVSLFQGLAVPAAHYGIGWLYADRVIVGIIDGFLYAPTFALAGQWAPRHETSLLFGIVGMGMELGNVLSYAVSLLACEIDIQEGWPFVFYILAGLGLIIALLFMIIVSDSPFYNQHISRKEVKFFVSCIPKRHHTPNEAPARVPVKEILTSGCVWAIVVSQIGSDWLYYFFVTMEPTFLKDVIKLSHLQVNLLTGLPFLGIIPTIYLSGYLCDKLVTRGIISNTKVRKINDFICKIIPSAILIGLGFLPQESTAAAFVLNLLGAMCMGFSYVSWMANPVDLAPAYTGFIVGVCEIGAIWVGIAVPIVFDEITLDKTREEWQLVFYITAGIQAFCFLFYAIFASGELQPWAFSSLKHEYDVLDGQDDVKTSLLDDAMRSKSHSKPDSQNDESQRLLTSLSLSLGGFQGTSSYEASVKRKMDARKSEGNIGSSTVVISGPAVTRTLLQSGHIPRESLQRQESLYRAASIDALVGEIRLGKPLPEFNVSNSQMILPKPTYSEPFGAVTFETEPYIESDDDSWQIMATRSLPSKLTSSAVHGRGERDLHLIMSSPLVSEENIDDELPGPPRNMKSLATEIVETLTVRSLNEPILNVEKIKSKAPGTKPQNSIFQKLRIHATRKKNENNAALTKRRNGSSKMSEAALYVDPKFTRNIINMKREHHSSLPRLAKKKQTSPSEDNDSSLNLGNTSSIMVSTEDSTDSTDAHLRHRKNTADLQDELSKGKTEVAGLKDRRKISRVVRNLFSFGRSKSTPDFNLSNEETFVFVADDEVEDATNIESLANKSFDSAKKTKQSSVRGQKEMHEKSTLKSQGNEDVEEEQVLFAQPRVKI